MNAVVSVIIPNLHSPVIGEVLGALLAQADALSKPLEVWVVGQDRYGQVQPDERVHMLTTAHPVPPAWCRVPCGWQWAVLTNSSSSLPGRTWTCPFG